MSLCEPHPSEATALSAVPQPLAFLYSLLPTLRLQLLVASFDTPTAVWPRLKVNLLQSDLASTNTEMLKNVFRVEEYDIKGIYVIV